MKINDIASTSEEKAAVMPTIKKMKVGESHNFSAWDYNGQVIRNAASQASRGRKAFTVGFDRLEQFYRVKRLK